MSDLAAHVELSEYSACRPLRHALSGWTDRRLNRYPDRGGVAARRHQSARPDAGPFSCFCRTRPTCRRDRPAQYEFAARGTGRAVAALLASLSGSVTASIHSGRLSNRVVNLAGQSIVSWVFEGTVDGGAPLVCFESSMNLENGVGKLRKLVVETDRVQFVGAGQLDLKTQSVDLTLAPRPKDRELVGTVGPIVIRGPLDAPEVSLAKGSVAGKVVGDTIGQLPRPRQIAPRWQSIAVQPPSLRRDGTIFGVNAFREMLARNEQ